VVTIKENLKNKEIKVNKKKLKFYHKFFPIIILPICSLILISYYWSGYSTLTQRPGINGNSYLYYKITMQQFYFYKFTVAFIAFILIILQIIFLLFKKTDYLENTFLGFLLFIILLFISIMILETLFVGKG
jgi:hypothetical protein